MSDHPTNPQVRLYDRMFYLDPHPHLRWLREHAPVYWDASADGGLPYEGVMQVMGALNASGFHDIGLVTEQGGPSFDGEDG